MDDEDGLRTKPAFKVEMEEEGDYTSRSSIKLLARDEEAPKVIKCSIPTCPNSVEHKICNKCEMVVEKDVMECPNDKTGCELRPLQVYICQWGNEDKYPDLMTDPAVMARTGKCRAWCAKKSPTYAAASLT